MWWVTEQLMTPKWPVSVCVGVYQFCSDDAASAPRYVRLWSLSHDVWRKSSFDVTLQTEVALICIRFRTTHISGLALICAVRIWVTYGQKKLNLGHFCLRHERSPTQTFAFLVSIHPFARFVPNGVTGVCWSPSPGHKGRRQRVDRSLVPPDPHT